MNSGVYEIVNRENGKRYIGSAVSFTNRWRDHRHRLNRGKHHSQYLQRAFDLHGAQAFEFNKLLVCARQQLLMYEQILISAMLPEYNAVKTAGSSLGHKHTESAKQKMRAAKIGRVMSDEHRAAISAANKGKRISPEAIAKRSAARIWKKTGPLSEEHRAKIGAAHKGKALSAKHVEKIRKAATGRSRLDMIGNKWGKEFTAERLAAISDWSNAAWAAQKQAGIVGRMRKAK